MLTQRLWRGYILYERGWYHDLHGAVNPTFGLLMHKEANLALGNWYFHQRHHHEDDKYVTLVKQLVNSNDVREREVAFYLIRHARPTYRQANVEVDESFLPLLERLYGDPDLFWRSKDLAMFRYNLGDDRLREIDSASVRGRRRKR